MHKTRQHTWNDMRFDVALLQVLHFFASSPKDKGIPALEPQH